MLIDYFNRFSPLAYRSSDDQGMTVVMLCTNPLEYAREAAGRMDEEIKTYGMMGDGTKFSLINSNIWSKSA
jgi:hypothetical protein